MKRYALRIGDRFHSGDGVWMPVLASAKVYPAVLDAVWDLTPMDDERGWRLVCAECGEAPCVGVIS